MNAAVLELLVQLISQSQKVAALVQAAALEGRSITREELDELKAENDEALARLEAAIDDADA